MTALGSEFDRREFSMLRMAGAVSWSSDPGYFETAAADLKMELEIGPYLTTDVYKEYGWYEKPTGLYAIRSDTEQPKAAGKLLGAYHYAEGKNAKSEAQYFVKCLGNRVKECVLALDWEGNQNSVFGTGKDVAWCKEFLDEVYRLTGVRPLIYMSKSVCRKYNWSSVAKDYPLWCAQYKSNSTTDNDRLPVKPVDGQQRLRRVGAGYNPPVFQSRQDRRL